MRMAILFLRQTWVLRNIILVVQHAIISESRSHALPMLQTMVLSQLESCYKIMKEFNNLELLPRVHGEVMSHALLAD